MTKISVYIILYYDLGFLDDVIKQVYDYVDEIVIIDGPYSYNIDIFKTLELYYDEYNKPRELQNIIDKYSTKIKYYRDTFINEEEKRKFGYSKCNNNIILALDCDELFVIDKQKLNEFIISDKFVGGFEEYKMNRINIYFDTPLKKNIIFKQSHINALDHLDYLRLVACKQKPVNNNYIYSDYLGIIYHQTLNRNKFNNKIKYIFYMCLYKYTNKFDITILGNYDIHELIKIVSISDLLNIFYHSMLPLIGIPEKSICTLKNDVKINLDNYNNNHIDGYFTNNKIGLKWVDCCFYLDINKCEQINVEFENIKNVKILLYEINLNEPCKINEYDFIDIKDNKILLNQQIVKKKNNINFVIKIKCTETINNSILFNIKCINII